MYSRAYAGCRWQASAAPLQAPLQQLTAVLAPTAGASVATARCHALDGSRGDNRASALPAATTADDYWQALQAWVEAKASRPSREPARL